MYALMYIAIVNLSLPISNSKWSVYLHFSLVQTLRYNKKNSLISNKQPAHVL
jgi:hypothetical protein